MVCVCAQSVQLFATPWNVDPRLLYPQTFPGKNKGWVAVSYPRDLLGPVI